MLYRKLLVVCALLFAGTTVHSTPKHKVDIKEATVFLSGAELYSTAKINIQAGESEVIFTNVAGYINTNSLNVGVNNGVVVQSATFLKDYLQEEILSPRAKEIKDSIELLQDKRNLNKNKITTVDEQIAIIQSNRKIGGESKGLSASELQQMLSLVKNNMNALLDEKTKYTNLEHDLVKKVKLLEQQLREEKQKGFVPGGQIKVKFYAKRATTSNVTITYLVKNAGWTPTYDIRVANVNAPVELGYKAHVYQNSGINWDKIKLTLSTGNPTQGAQAPTLSPWHLAFYTPRPYSYENKANVSTAGARGDGNRYVIDGVQVYGERGINLADKAKAPQSDIGNYVNVNNSGVNTVFDIDLPYTIPSDGKQVNVAIKTAKLNATYRYFAVPKLDRDAFLQARITDWEDLDLLPAQTNIFYEGTYVGQGYIDVRNVKDTFNLSLGRDKKVVVRRELDKKMCSVKTIGTNIREQFEYKISIRNTRKENIELVLLDQIPVSNDKSIEIDDKKYDGGSYNETTGAVEWKLNLKPAEAKEVRIGYTVKFPKGKQINL